MTSKNIQEKMQNMDPYVINIFLLFIINWNKLVSCKVKTGPVGQSLLVPSYITMLTIR